MENMAILHDGDADFGVLNGKTIAVIGYGAQGRAQALCMRDSGLNVIIGIRPGKSKDAADQDGFETMSVTAPVITPGKTLSFSHGFSIVFGEIKPTKDVDVIMIAPKSPGTEERKRFVEGFGVPGLIAVKQNPSGKAKEVALAIAKAEGLTRAGVLECTFEQETYEDLFGEQNVLCGGMVDLMKYGFETLIEAGYPPEMAYFECIHEAKLIVDLIYEGGIQKMNAVISNTAEWGEYDNGPWIINPEVKTRMKESLRRIESGEFAKKWIAEARNGAPTLKAKRAALGEHPAEIVGKRIRSLFQKK